MIRFHDLLVHHEHQREIHPASSGRALAEAVAKGWFELPLFNHEIKQLIARANLLAAAMPELDFPPLDAAAVTLCLTRAFSGMTLAKEAQAEPLRDAFLDFIGKGRLDWLNELFSVSIPWLHQKPLKLLYRGVGAGRRPAAQLARSQRQIKRNPRPPGTSPRLCEGRLPVELWPCAPDGQRLEATLNWPAFKSGPYQKLKPALKNKYPSVVWIRSLFT